MRFLYGYKYNILSLTDVVGIPIAVFEPVEFMAKRRAWSLSCIAWCDKTRLIKCSFMTVCLFACESILVCRSHYRICCWEWSYFDVGLLRIVLHNSLDTHLLPGLHIPFWNWYEWSARSSFCSVVLGRCIFFACAVVFGGRYSELWHFAILCRGFHLFRFFCRLTTISQIRKQALDCLGFECLGNRY